MRITDLITARLMSVSFNAILYLLAIFVDMNGYFSGLFMLPEAFSLAVPLSDGAIP